MRDDKEEHDANVFAVVATLPNAPVGKLTTCKAVLLWKRLVKSVKLPLDKEPDGNVMD